MTPDEIETIGVSLAAAREGGALVDVPLDRIATDAEAEDVQVAAIEAYGGTALGYSVQATTALTRRLLCCDGPIFGPLVDSDVLKSGASFRLPRGMLGAGCAFSFLLGRPYPRESEEISRDTVATAISSCRIVIELLGRRVPGASPLNARTAAADFALMVLFVQGPRVDRWADVDLAAAQVTARIDGQVAATGCGANVMEHPFDAVAWLARALASRARAIEAGEIVATGTCLGILQVIPGQTFEADFGSLGTVRLKLE